MKRKLEIVRALWALFMVAVLWPKLVEEDEQHRRDWGGLD